MSSIKSRYSAALFSILYLFLLITVSSSCGFREIAPDDEEGTEGSAGTGGAAGTDVSGGTGGDGGQGEGEAGQGGSAGGAGGEPPGGEGGEGGDGPPDWPPSDECDPAECGPAPGMPNFPCPDGSMGGPVCVRREDGSCGWKIRECPPETEQACTDCSETEYCSVENCGRNGEQGKCLARPEMCYEIWAPVCGCDGQTYGNDCMANGSGTSIDYAGECKETDPNDPPPDGKRCGGLTPGPSGGECYESEFCYYPTGDCGFADAQGVCVPRPDACTFEWNPVCGCDGQTYGNECAAANAGVSVWYMGECR